MLVPAGPLPLLNYFYPLLWIFSFVFYNSLQFKLGTYFYWDVLEITEYGWVGDEGWCEEITTVICWLFKKYHSCCDEPIEINSHTPE